MNRVVLSWSGLLRKVVLLSQAVKLPSQLYWGMSIFITALLFVELFASVLSLPLMSWILEPSAGIQFPHRLAHLLPAALQSELPPTRFVLCSLVAALIGLRLLGSALVFLLSVHVVRLSERFAVSLRNALASHYLHAGKAFFDQKDSGHLLNMCFESILPVSQQLRSVRTVLRMLITVPVYSAILLYVSWQWTVFAAVFFTLLLPWYALLLFDIRRLSTHRASLNRSLTSRFGDILQSGSLTSLCNASDREHRNLLTRSEEIAETTERIARKNSMLRVLQQAAITLAGGIVLLYAVLQVDSPGRGTAIALLLLFMYFLRRLHLQVTAGIEALGGIASIEGQLDQMLELLQDGPHFRIPDGSTRVSGFQTLTAHHLSFSYPDGTAALHDVSCTINRGERIALVGKTGCGKSTLAKLLVRLYDAPAGSIQLNGLDSRNYALESLRNTIALADQHPHLFRSSIRENLCFGAQRRITDQELQQLLEDLLLAERISLLPAGLDSRIGDQGVQLSGGELQRLVLGRTLLQETEMLILDEATSQLDAETEASVLDFVMNRRADVTLLIISHRTRFIENCDRVLRLQGGRLVEDQPLLRSQSAWDQRKRGNV